MFEVFEVFESICQQRRSVRGFLPQAVPKDVLDDVFSVAQLTPSSCNTQPWKTKVVSGAVCDTLRGKFVDVMNAGEFKPDFEHSMSYEGVYKERQYAAAAELYTAMSIERKDKAARHEAFLNNFKFFGAPHALFLGMDEGFGLREAVDLGMYAQSLMLAMTAHGIASCPQNALSFNGDLLRETLNLDANWRVLMGISFGYEDESIAANKARVSRDPVSSNVEFFE